MLQLTIVITDDELLSWFLLLSLWLLNDTVLGQFIRSYIVIPKKQVHTKEVKAKKLGKHKNEVPKEAKGPTKTIVVTTVIDEDDSSYAPTCDSTDYSKQEESASSSSGVFKLPSSDDDEIKRPGKKVNFGTVTDVVWTTKPPQFITIETPTKQQRSQIQRAQASISSGSSASSSASMVSEKSDTDASLPLPDSTASIPAKAKKSSLKYKTPAVTQLKYYRLDDRRTYVGWKLRSFPATTGLKPKPISNFGRERVPFKNLKADI